MAICRCSVCSCRPPTCTSPTAAAAAAAAAAVPTSGSNSASAPPPTPPVQIGREVGTCLMCETEREREQWGARETCGKPNSSSAFPCSQGRHVGSMFDEDRNKPYHGW